jgi:hypothetical protein
MSSTRSAKQHCLRIFALIGLALLAVASARGGQDRPERGCEPRLPLEVELRTLAADGASTGILLVLDLAAKTDLAAVRCELVRPQAVRVLADLDNRGLRLDRGERKTLPFRVAADGPVTIQVRVVAVTAAGLVFRRGASLELDGEGRPERRSPGGTVRLSPEGGRPVREFPARAVTEAGR